MFLEEVRLGGLTILLDNFFVFLFCVFWEIHTILYYILVGLLYLFIYLFYSSGLVNLWVDFRLWYCVHYLIELIIIIFAVNNCTSLHIACIFTTQEMFDQCDRRLGVSLSIFFQVENRHHIKHRKWVGEWEKRRDSLVRLPWMSQSWPMYRSRNRCRQNPNLGFDWLQERLVEP